MKTYKSIGKKVAVVGMTAALYAVVTIMLPFLSYREIQCRFSEILNLLAFINPIFAPGVILGCFIANIASPYGVVDMIVGTAQTALAMFFITRAKNLFTASLFPTLTCVIIGAEIFFMSGEPYTLGKFFLITLPVMAGEFIAMTVIGYPLFRFVIMKNEKLVRFLKMQ